MSLKLADLCKMEGTNLKTAFLLAAVAEWGNMCPTSNSFVESEVTTIANIFMKKIVAEKTNVEGELQSQIAAAAEKKLEKKRVDKKARAEAVQDARTQAAEASKQMADAVKNAKEAEKAVDEAQAAADSFSDSDDSDDDGEREYNLVCFDCW